MAVDDAEGDWGPESIPPRSSGPKRLIPPKDLEHTSAAPRNTEPLNSIHSGGTSQYENSSPWARLGRRFTRPLFARSTSSISSFQTLPSIGQADSEEYSIEVGSPQALILSTPTLENAEYRRRLREAVDRLKNDFVSGAREMADSAISALSDLIEAAAVTAENRDELWKMAVVAAKALSEARPSMSAAITSCLLRALEEIRRLWETLDEKKNKSAVDLAAMSRRQLMRILEQRKEAGIRLGENFAERLKAYCRQQECLNNTHSLTILTLSNSSTIRSSILTTLSTLRFLHLTLHILESRPRFEGADMASQILSSISAEARARLRVRIHPDCAVATAAKDADMVLLGADRISAKGDVSNKIGSLAAAICVKAMNPKAQVVVVSDGDKIVAPDAEEGEKEVHPDSEMMEAWGDDTRREVAKRIEGDGVEVFGEWFEWVSAGYVDGYVTEKGTLDTGGVEKAAAEIGELKRQIFD
ncbi:hypothetical protein N0V90_007549 [Kalmusia sp. IMI 367209]|nr:hypothetical protein N0V90_007549 [Kalmusia sp. IMI 367209]